MIHFPDPKCDKCGHNKGGKCKLMDCPPNTNFCSYYTESPYICEICKAHLPKEAVCWEKGTNSYHIVCSQCSSTMGKCNNCANSSICRFQQDNTIAAPLYVTQTIQQGPMITQQQVKNPARIQQTCINCPCYISDECQRSNNGSCEKYSCSVENW